MGKNIVWDLIANDKASPAFRKLGGEVDDNSSKLSKWSNAGKVAGAAVGVALVAFGKASVGAYTEAEESQSRLEFAFKRFPALADTNIDKLRGLNTELSRKTKFDDDSLAAGQAVLAQYKLTGKQLEDVTPLVADYAAKSGKDVPTAAKDFGKALLGNTRALKDLGISYKSTGDSTQDYANITALMREKVGGFAEKEGKTAAGQAAIMRNQFGEVEETVGQKLVPALTALAGVLISGITFMQDHGTATKVALAAVGLLAVGVGALVVASKIHAVVLASQVEGTFAYAVVSKAQAAATGIATGAQWLLNAALEANPIGLVVVAVALLVAGFVLAYKKSEDFRDVVQGAMRGVVSAFGWVQDKASAVFGWAKDHWPLLLGILTGPFGLMVGEIAQHWGAVKTGFTNVRDWIGDKWSAFKGWVDGWTVSPGELWSAIKTSWTAVRDWVGDKWSAFKGWVEGWTPNFGGMFDGVKTAFRSAFNAVIGWWNGLSFGIPGVDKGPIHIPGVSIGTPNIPYLAAGGVVTRPTIAMIGEAGPEAVIPLDQAGLAGGTFTVNLVLDGKVIQQALLKVKRGNGGLELGLA